FLFLFFFFFQAEDGIRDFHVTGVQTCALPIFLAGDTPVDDLYTSFGLRQVRVDSTAPRILLNGNPIVFNGVALHEEAQLPVRQRSEERRVGKEWRSGGGTEG